MLTLMPNQNSSDFRTLRWAVGLSLLLVPSLLAKGSGQLSRETDTRPNILVIYVDDLGYGDLGSRHHTLKTPNIDRLASQGMSLNQYYAPSPLCSPSRAALLTGRTPFRTGIESWIPEDTNVQLGPKEITIAALLSSIGYDTFHGGKWHLNGGLDNKKHTQPQDHGFDEWISLHAFAIPNHKDPENLFYNGKPLGRVEGYAAQITVDATLEWLDKQQATDNPFFVYLATAEPHGTVASPPQFNRQYARFTNGAVDPIVNGAPEPAKNLEARGPGEYWANITHLDFQIGRVLDWLDDKGLTEQTFVFFASDNGPVTTDWRHWWEINLYGATGGLRGRKADLYEGGIRVPAIVRWPGEIAAGSESNALISGYDLLPTLATVAGFDVPADRPMDGEDVSAALHGETFTREHPLYWEFDDDQGFHFALRSGNYKLIADKSFERTELYDLEKDPFEVLNLAESRPDLLAQLSKEIRGYASQVQSDPLKPDLTVGRFSKDGSN